MSMQSISRPGGSVPDLPGAGPFGTLSRRAAMVGAVAVAGFRTRRLVQPIEVPASIAPASADADLIGRADRLVSLARRCDAVAEHRATLEDRVTDLCPRPAPLPKPPFHHTITETPTATGRVLHLHQDDERDPAWVRWEEATAAAKAAHERQEAEVGARLGLPEIERRFARMDRRRERWAADLASSRTTTAAGLGAKAGALLALVGGNRFSAEEEVSQHVELVLSVLADAVRLGTGGEA